MSAKDLLKLMSPEARGEFLLAMFIASRTEKRAEKASGVAVSR